MVDPVSATTIWMVMIPAIRKFVTDVLEHKKSKILLMAEQERQKGEAELRRYNEKERDKERQARMQGERERDKHLREVVQLGISLFIELLRHQQQASSAAGCIHHCRCHDCQNESQRYHHVNSEYPERQKTYEKHIGALELPEGFDRHEHEVLRIFNSSLSKGNQVHYANSAEFSTHLKCPKQTRSLELFNQPPARRF